MPSSTSSSLSWDSLDPPLQPWIRTAIDVMGFERMTPVQAATIPMFSANKDVVVDSVTGSGKTLAFVIPIIEKLLSERRSSGSPQGKNAHFFALVLAPTRELSEPDILRYRIVFRALSGYSE